MPVTPGGETRGRLSLSRFDSRVREAQAVILRRKLELDNALWGAKLQVSVASATFTGTLGYVAWEWVRTHPWRLGITMGLVALAVLLV